MVLVSSRMADAPQKERFHIETQQVTNKTTQFKLVNIDQNKSTMETNYAMEKVFSILLIYQDSLLHLFNTITILKLQKLSGLTTNFFWGGNEQTDLYRFHSLAKSLLQNPTPKRPARCQQQCIDHQEPQGSATVWLPVGRRMGVWVAFSFANSFDKIYTLR